MWLRGNSGKAYFPTDAGILDLSGESSPPYSSVDMEGYPSAIGAHQTAAVTLSATHTHNLAPPHPPTVASNQSRSKLHGKIALEDSA